MRASDIHCEAVAIVMYVNHVQRSEEMKAALQGTCDKFLAWRCHAVAREQHVRREDLNSLNIFPFNCTPAQAVVLILSELVCSTRNIVYQERDLSA